MIGRLNHVAIAVPDLEAASSLYRGALGADVTERPVAVPDLFQSLCHSLGIDPNAENTTSSGRPIKVVDKGSVVRELFS